MLQAERNGIDQLSGVLRTTASRRRHGVLAVHASPHGYEIFFHSGKISFIQSTDVSFARRLCDRLIRGGYIPETSLEGELGNQQELRGCFEYLTDECGLSPDLVLQAVHTIQQDLLHSLRTAEVFGNEFRTSVADVDPAFTLSLSPGQLLLDLVEVESDLEQFSARFSSEDEPIIRKRPLSETVPAAAKSLWKELPSEMLLSDLVAASLRSEHEIKALLVALYDAESIALASEFTLLDAVDDEETVNFAQNQEGAPQSVRLEDFDDEDGFDLFAPEHPAADSADIQTEAGKSAEGDGMNVTHEDISECGAEDPFAGEFPEFPDNLPVWDSATGKPYQVAQVESGGIVSHTLRRSILRFTSARIGDWNFLLREEEGLKLAGVLVMAAVMIALGFFLPSQLLDFIRALGAASDTSLPWNALL